MNRVTAFLSDTLNRAIPNGKLLNAWKKSLRGAIDYLLAYVEASELALLRDALAAAASAGEGPDVAGPFPAIGRITADKRVCALGMMAFHTSL